MKKTKRILLSLFATVAIMASMLVVPVSASDTILMSSEDFEGYSNGDSFSTFTVVTDNGNNYIKERDNWGMQAFTANTGTGGIVKAKFDFLCVSTLGAGYVNLYNGSPHTKANHLSLLYKDQATIRSCGTGLFSATQDVWYTEEAIIDLDTKKVIVTIYNKSTGVTAGYLNTTLAVSNIDNSGWPATNDNYFASWLISSNTDNIHLDNFSIERYVYAATSVYTETLQSSEDFEGYSNGDSFSTFTVVTDNGNNYIKERDNWGMQAFNANTGTGGIVKAKFDFLCVSTLGAGYVNLYNGSPHTKANHLSLLYKDQATIRSCGTGLFSATQDVWYTEEAIIDLDTKKVIVTIYNRLTGENLGYLNTTLAVSSADNSGWPATNDNYFGSWLISSNTDNIHLDNFSITRYSDGYRFSEDYQHSTAPSNGAIVTEGSNKYVRATTSWAGIVYNFNSVSSDKIRVTFDFKNDATNNNALVALSDSTHINTANELLTLLYLNENGYYQAYSSDGNTRRLGSRVTNTWLSCEAIIDIDSKKATTTIIDKLTGAVVGTQTAALSVSSAQYSDWPNTVSAFDTLTFVGSGANAIYVDDVVVEKIITAPVAEAENVEVYDYFSTLQNTWTAVSPASMTYNIDFETNMNSSTVTASNIYIKAAGAGEAVSGRVTYSNHIATLTLSSLLEENTTYTLHIDGDVANTAGVTLGTDKEYTIITTEGTTSADMGTPTIGGSAVGNFSGITAGQTITVPVTYVNTTGIAKTLHFIYAYFGTGENSLKKFGYSTTSVGSSVIGNNYNFTHSFQNVDGAVLLKFMIWDGFDTILSLSSPVTIKN